MSYKRLTPCIFIYQGKAVKWFDDKRVVSDSVTNLARAYSDQGADEILILDLTDNDEDHEEAFDIIKKVHKKVNIPIIAGGNIRKLDDVKKYLYAGAKRAILDFSKSSNIELIEEVSTRFGKDRICVSLGDFDTLYKQRKVIEKFSSDILFMHRVDTSSVYTITELPYMVLTDTMEEDEILKILKSNNSKGVSGKFVSQKDFKFKDFKKFCKQQGINMTSFESLMDFSEFKLNSDGLLPVVVQDYKSNDVLMVAYMNEEAFVHTIKSGKMTYYSRSRKSLWVKGETSGHFQKVKTLTIDCDNDTLLAKVEQIGAACHTGNPTCFFQPVAGMDYEVRNPIKVFEQVYSTIVDRKKNPKEGSYTNYLFEQGVDKILKKIGEEATELVIAAKNPNPEEIKYELSDFLYHAMVLMVEKGISWEDITEELARR